MVTLPPSKQYYPFKAEPFRVAMGLFPLELANWIEIDETFPEQLAERHRLLTGQSDAVFSTLPEAAEGSQELLTLLVNHLTHHFPTIYTLRGQTLFNHITAEQWNLDHHGLHPLDLCGRLIQEDLCLMGRDPTTGVYRLIGASLCFPTRWRLSEKLGRSLATIHAPTPHYAANIGRSMDRLFDKLKADRPLWRTNWNVLDDGELFQPEGHSIKAYETDITAENAGEKVWLRIERQTLRRLPQSNNILFTIRIYNNPFNNLRDKPEVAGRLAGAMRGKDPAMLHYKSMNPILQPALIWLEKIAAA